MIDMFKLLQGYKFPGNDIICLHANILKKIILFSIIITKSVYD